MRISPPFLRWFLAYPLLGSSCYRSFAVEASYGGAKTVHRLLPCRSTIHRRCHHGGCFSSRYHSSSSYFTSRRTTPGSSLSQQAALYYSTQQHSHNPDLLTSTSSNTVKRFAGLTQKAKKRRESGETVVEGPRMILDLLKSPSTSSLIQQIIISTDLEDKTKQELNAYLQTITDHSISIQTATPAVVKACCDTVTPQGIVARVQIPFWRRDDIANSQENEKTSQAPLYLVLDGVSDPGNLGTLLRSSVAVGVAAVLLLPGSCDVWNPKAVRSAMGASFVVPTFVVSSWDEALDQLSDWNCNQIWAATMLEDNQGQVVSSAHYDIDWNAKPQALVIGSEGTGLSAPVRQSLAAASEIKSNESRIQAVHVPMQGTIESLNAAVCGSVILFEYMRQWQQQQQ